MWKNKELEKSFTEHVLGKRERKTTGVNVKQECLNGATHITIIIEAIWEKLVKQRIKACKRLYVLTHPSGIPLWFALPMAGVFHR